MIGALCLGILLLPLIVALAGTILLLDGRPVFYISERAKRPGDSFSLIKLRTMRPCAGPQMAMGGHKSAEITRLGRVLRKTRADELPQLFNILRGDMSFVGPRPPLPGYVVQFPELYGEVLRCRPGVTGLASLVYFRREEMLLSQCKTQAETNALYARICVPRKAALDLIYQRNQSLWLDLSIMARTVARVLKR